MSESVLPSGTQPSLPPDPAQMLRSIVETSEDAIVAKSPLGVVLTWNAGAERVFGYPAEEALGKHISLIIPPDRLGEETVIMSRLRAGEPVRRFETLRRRRDGSLVPVELSITPIRDAAGRLLGATKIARDLSAHKGAEAALREKEERFHTLANNISQLAWMANEEGGIFWYNQRWFEFTGTTFEEMQGWGWLRVHHPDHVDRVVARLQHSWDSGEPWEDTFPLRGRDGEYRWFLSRALPIRGDGNAIVRWFGTNTDITDERRLQDELRLITQELALTNRQKDEFLAALSHELRNPLGAVRTSLAVLRANRPMTGAGPEALAIADRQVAQIARLLDDLLDTSRGTRGKMTLALADVDLLPSLEDAVAVTAPLFAASAVALEVALPPGPLPVRADAARVQQMVANVLANASRYTPAGGRARLTVTREGGELVIEVADDGVGIAADLLPKVFDLFTQAQPDTAAAKVGLGVGLYLTRTLAEMHGGSVAVASAGRGLGSTFTLRLPVLLDGLPAPPAPSARPSGVLRRVLVVDDDLDNAFAMAALLRMAGHTVEVAHDGGAAQVAAREHNPEFVLLDLGMPGMDGYAVCAALRAMPLAARPKIVALTGWGQPQDRERTRAAGFDEHLVKPVDPAAILALVAAT